MPGQQARTVFGGRGDSNVTSLLGGSKRAFGLRAGRLLHPSWLVRWGAVGKVSVFATENSLAAYPTQQAHVTVYSSTMTEVVFLPEADIPEPDAAIVRESVSIHVSAIVVSAAHVRRSVNGWLLWEVGERLSSGPPELVLGSILRWRIPVRWTSPTQGVLAERVCDVYVDATDGSMIDAEAKKQEIHQQVERYARALLPANS